MNKVFYFLCLSALLSMTNSCDSKKGCKQLETRCHDNKAQICNPDGEWVTFHDCGKENLMCFVVTDEKVACFESDVIPLPPENKKDIE